MRDRTLAQGRHTPRALGRAGSPQCTGTRLRTRRPCAHHRYEYSTGRTCHRACVYKTVSPPLTNLATASAMMGALRVSSSCAHALATATVCTDQTCHRARVTKDAHPHDAGRTGPHIGGGKARCAYRTSPHYL